MKQIINELIKFFLSPRLTSSQRDQSPVSVPTTDSNYIHHRSESSAVMKDGNQCGGGEGHVAAGCGGGASLSYQETFNSKTGGETYSS